MEPVIPQARRVMVVADPSRESASALQYALSHVLLEQDELILIHVENPSAWRNPFSTIMRRPNLHLSHPTASGLSSSSDGAAAPAGDVDFLDDMKHQCEIAQPKLRVSVTRVHTEAYNKAAAILYQTKALGIDLLVIGQRRSLSNAILGYKRQGGSIRGARGMDTAEYLIENSKCTCVGVQRRGLNAGYLLNTKTHRNFWLLA